jgi:hypothetical protein
MLHISLRFLFHQLLAAGVSALPELCICKLRTIVAGVIHLPQLCICKSRTRHEWSVHIPHRHILSPLCGEPEQRMVH